MDISLRPASRSSTIWSYAHCREGSECMGIGSANLNFRAGVVQVVFCEQWPVFLACCIVIGNR